MSIVKKSNILDFYCKKDEYARTMRFALRNYITVESRPACVCANTLRISICEKLTDHNNDPELAAIAAVNKCADKMMELAK